MCSWEKFVVEYGFVTINDDGSLYFTEEMKARIINIDKTCLSLDRINSNQGGDPTVMYYNVRFTYLGKATSKSALSMTMICWRRSWTLSRWPTWPSVTWKN